jgi:hypothetical protein
VSTVEELLGRKISGSVLEKREHGLRGSAALTTRHPSNANVGSNFVDKRRSLGIVRSRTQAMGFFFNLIHFKYKAFWPGPDKIVISSTIIVFRCLCTSNHSIDVIASGECITPN